MSAQISSSTESGKAKQTRRRQRLSCVECTKRRQKCDRNIPCGLCVSRGVSHLCRWEPLVVRPSPQRPPIVSSSAAETIEVLANRIAVLERTIQRQQTAITKSEQEQALTRLTSGDSSSLQPSSLQDEFQDASDSSSADDMNRVGGPHALIDYKMQVAAVALAQLSLAPHTEYVGGGTILCALHRLGDVNNYRIPYAPSCSIMSAITTPFTAGIHSFFNLVRSLIAGIPPRPVVEGYLNSFFAEKNWEFQIPDNWIHCACQQIWDHLDRRCTSLTCSAAGGCPACRQMINPHCLVLLFAILALAPGISSDNSVAYFTHALSAKRLGEDILLASPAYSTSESAVHGAVLSCMGQALLAAYLADRGRVSEAWKLTGGALRNAQAMGLHRDPGWSKWEIMGKEESELRMLGWWQLYCSDRVYSFILGRPMMASRGTFDVTLLPMEEHGDGSPNPHAAFGQAFIRLCDLIGSGTDECLSIVYPPYSKCLEVDAALEAWLADLPDHLRWREYPPAPEDPSSLTQQRIMLASYFLGGVMSVHRPYLMHPIPDDPSSNEPSSSAQSRKVRNASRERCIELAIELVRILCSVWDFDNSVPSTVQSNFFYVYFIFDGAVALAGALSQKPPHLRAAECLELMDRAMKTLDDCVTGARRTGGSNGEGEIANRAIVVLQALRKAGGWNSSSEYQDGVQEPVDHKGEFSSTIGEGTGRAMLPVDQSAIQAHASIQQQQQRPFSNTQDMFTDFSIPTTTGAAHHSGTTSPYIATSPYVSHPFQSPPVSVFPPEPSSAYAPSTMSGGFSELSYSGTGSDAGDSKVNTQSVMLPFEMLLSGGVFESEWARLAGMENWNQGSSSHLG